MFKVRKFNFLENFIRGFASFGNFYSTSTKDFNSNEYNNLDYNFNNIAFIISKNFNKMKEYKNEEKKRKFRNKPKKK